jgi:NAD(P)-dependent dehydrogenase (short-subunit alcohol dehydrogenase family)
LKLEGKSCLITGGTRGLGAATAKEFAARGADLALVGRYMDEEAIAVRDEIAALGRRCVLIQADIAKPDECSRCVAETVETLGGVDVLFHNAGGPVPGGIMEVTPEAWHAAFAVHVDAAFYLCRAAIPHMKTRGEGAILLMASSAAVRGCLGAFAYGTVKGAMLNFTRALARELADDNIRVNCVAPGVIRTRFHQNMSEQTYRNNLENRIPLHREGKPEDVAAVVAMLAENEFMTGETVVVDGGLTMRIA